MTKKELIEALASYPDDMDVFISPSESGFQYNPVDFVESKEIGFKEDTNDAKPLASEKVIVLSDFY